MQCRKCYAHISTNTGYCPMCGEPLSAYPPTYTSAPAKPSGGGFMSAPSDLNSPSSYAPAPRPVKPAAPAYPSFSDNDATLTDAYAPIYTEPRMTTPRPAAPAPVYSPPPSYAAPQRLPVQRDVSPLSVTGVMITAIVSTILLLFSLKRIFDPPALFSNFFAFLDLIDEGLAETMQWLLYKLLPMDELENMMNIIQLIGELPNIAAVIGMWCIFGAISGRELNRGLFCGSISFIKFFRILSLIAAIVPTILVAFSPLFLGGSDFGDYFTEVFATIYFVCLLSLLFVVAYRSAIVRLLTALQDGARSGHYRGASGFLILCLFVSGIASGISSLLTGVSDMDAVIELLRGSLLPLIYAICLCTYNSRRHSINHS